MAEDDLQYCGRKIHLMKVAIGEAESDAYALAKNISEKQAEHKRIIEALKKEQRAEILDLEKAHRQIKKKIGVMKFELSQMTKHRAELRDKCGRRIIVKIKVEDFDSAWNVTEDIK